MAWKDVSKMDVIIMVKSMRIMGWAGLSVRVTMWVGGRVEGRG